MLNYTFSGFASDAEDLFSVASGIILDGITIGNKINQLVFVSLEHSGKTFGSFSVDAGIPLVCFEIVDRIEFKCCTFGMSTPYRCCIRWAIVFTLLFMYLWNISKSNGSIFALNFDVSEYNSSLRRPPRNNNAEHFKSK